MTVAGDALFFLSPIPPLKKKAFPHSRCDQHLLTFDHRGRRGRLSPRSTPGCSEGSREQTWAPTASWPDPASTRFEGGNGEPHRVLRTRTNTAAHHEPRQGAQKLLPPRSRRPAHPHQLTRPDDASFFGNEGPHLAGEVGGKVGHACCECWPACVGGCERSEGIFFGESISKKIITTSRAHEHTREKTVPPCQPAPAPRSPPTLVDATRGGGSGAVGRRRSAREMPREREVLAAVSAPSSSSGILGTLSGAA
jgi:hypothetical protein